MDDLVFVYSASVASDQEDENVESDDFVVYELRFVFNVNLFDKLKLCNLKILFLWDFLLKAIQAEVHQGCN